MWLELGSSLPFVLVSNNPFPWAVQMIDDVLPARNSGVVSVPAHRDLLFPPGKVGDAAGAGKSLRARFWCGVK